jgi:hypothetical protein
VVKRFTQESPKAGYQLSPDVPPITESVMAKLILCILLGATTVQAGDTRDFHREAMEFCKQFVILDPDPGIRLGYRLDCHLDDQDDIRGAHGR